MTAVLPSAAAAPVSPRHSAPVNYHLPGDDAAEGDYDAYDDVAYYQDGRPKSAGVTSEESDVKGGSKRGDGEGGGGGGGGDGEGGEYEEEEYDDADADDATDEEDEYDDPPDPRAGRA